MIEYKNDAFTCVCCVINWRYSYCFELTQLRIKTFWSDKPCRWILHTYLNYEFSMEMKTFYCCLIELFWFILLWTFIFLLYENLFNRNLVVIMSLWKYLFVFFWFPGDKMIWKSELWIIRQFNINVLDMESDLAPYLCFSIYLV